ncbi:MAG: helicase, RecD/TraA family [Firmicutes bacterium]|nr:helicase, RecD/TraA family [Bacillota bacterium]
MDIGVIDVEHLEGTVENIIFQNAGNGFVVFKLKPSNENSPVAVVGSMLSPLVGEQLELTGEWVEHARFGRQFKIVNYKKIAPSSVKGIERFLASGAIKGIGAAMAARLVKQFGIDTLEIIGQKSHRLLEVEGIGKKKATAIHKAYSEQSEMHEVMLFLEMNGVTGAYAGKIFAKYGFRAIEVLQGNPYKLAQEVRGIGFRTADQIAMSLGLERNHDERLTAGIDFALLQISQAGHCCVPEDILVKEAAKLLLVEAGEVALHVSALIAGNMLCVEDFHGMNLIYPRYLYYAEKRVAERLLLLKDRAKPAPNEDFEGIVAIWEGQSGITLAEAQHEAVLSSLMHGVLVLTGGPGTGKTTVVRGMLAVLEAQGFKILLGAPTGRAAKRLSEATDREAMTVHRLLESTGGAEEGAPLFMRNEDQPLEADVVIIDEVSMMDISLMNSLLEAIPDGCRVILVGDVDQLPAVGPGSVLKDIIRSATVPVVRLTEVFRQAGESMIVMNAHQINRGMLPDFRSIDFQFVQINDSDAVAQAVVELCRDQLPTEGFNVSYDVQVLAPMHRLVCGVENLNKLLQEALNPETDGKAAIVGANQILREGDKIMQMKNNYTKGVYNGDIGFITGIDHGRVAVRYPEQDVIYERGEVEELHLAYAMSVHKSQGSEYPVVIMPLISGHHIMLQRNLLYTAVTRAKQRVILLGSKAALNTALSNDRTKRRYSLLAERLVGEEL